MFVGFNVGLNALINRRNIVCYSYKLVETRCFQSAHHIVDGAVREGYDQNSFAKCCKDLNENDDCGRLATSWSAQHHVIVVAEDALYDRYLLLLVE